MGHINIGRVLLGGLAAGLVLSTGEYVLNDQILASQMKVYFAQHNFALPTGKAVGVAIAMTFVLGIVMMLGYAAIRPRFGGGPKTAIIVGLFAWFGVYCYGNTLAAAFGLIPANGLPVLLAWGLVEYLLGALVGASLYKED
jgi:hypothetical protein